jgi:hypothetical protein
MSPRGAAVGVAAAVVVLAATDPAHLERAADELAALARRRRLAVAGAGASAGLATRIGAELLDVDPVTAAAVVARGYSSRASRSAIVSRRRMRLASPPPTRTAAGRGTPL